METRTRIITIFTYIVRALLAYVYIPHGLEKLYTKINVQEYIDFKLGQDFIDFYLIWEKSGYIWVIGIAQFLGGLLLLFKRTYLFGAVCLLPVSIGMFFCHIFISHAQDFLIFDALVLILNLYLILLHFKSLKSTFFKPQNSWI
ncbi:DoxX family membrane protein [Pedobacter caeni]|uniref:DoxX protein n=1 Tax=Pedobacter caeni TaxID=288992 RepID=A0A1M5HPK2_9SPHI|nr:DoxX family membrane protein [Pedobacter caeni]SHG17904.1 DoxX protein [Pedobacter caeni]